MSYNLSWEVRVDIAWVELTYSLLDFSKASKVCCSTDSLYKECKSL